MAPSSVCVTVGQGGRAGWKTRPPTRCRGEGAGAHFPFRSGRAGELKSQYRCDKSSLCPRTSDRRIWDWGRLAERRGSPCRGWIEAERVRS
jgi:hypothetical protein